MVPKWNLGNWGWWIGHLWVKDGMHVDLDGAVGSTERVDGGENWNLGNRLVNCG